MANNLFNVTPGGARYQGVNDLDMNETQATWIKELDDEITNVHSDEVNDEALSNMFTFGISQDWSAQEIVDFLMKCSDLYSRKNNGSPMWFYAWYDEGAFQLRISAISQSHEKLPFRCEINSTSLQQLAKGVLNNDSGLDNGKLNLWQANV